MSLRSARMDDCWRRVFSRKYPNRYERLGFDELFCLGSGVVEFDAGISVIVGGNGVGKSTLAAALGELLETELDERFVAERKRLVGSTLRGSIKEGEVEKTRNAAGGRAAVRQLTGDPISVESWWLDPGFWAFHTRAQVVRDANFGDVLEPLTPKILSQDELGTLSYVIGKEYSTCKIFEVTDYAGFHRFPYFRVTANGIEYGSEGMGQGELALMLILWVLADLKSGSILVLEEPESHVSPRSQAALMNVVASTVASKGVWTIVTTHSPVVASRVPTKHLRLLVREGDQISILNEVRRHDVAAILGGGHAFGSTALVEDEVAKEFTIALLDELDPDLLRQLEILVANGESKISATLEAFPGNRGWFRLVGIFDGDQRGRVHEDKLNWPVVYLPGDTDPAVLLKEAFSSHGAIDRISGELRLERARILAAANAGVGLEPRDWLIELVKRLAISKNSLVRALLRAWLDMDGKRAQANEFVRSIAKAYNDGASKSGA